MRASELLVELVASGMRAEHLQPLLDVLAIQMCSDDMDDVAMVHWISEALKRNPHDLVLAELHWRAERITEAGGCWVGPRLPFIQETSEV